MRSNPRELLVVAGEASGDLHGARLISELRQRVPGLATFGLGGDEMRAAGLQSVAHSSEVAVVGITEVLKVLPRIREVFADLLREVDRRRPALAVLIDFPDFNLRLARRLKQRGLPVVYYISPQVWAWRRGRVKTIARLVDRMLVLFPFEVGFYRDHGVDVVHVGHPLVDEVPSLPQAWDGNAGNAGEAGPFRVALLPGSRVSEVEALLPALLAAAGLLAAELPVEVRIIRAPTVPRELLDEAVALSGLTVEIVERDRFAAVAGSHVALCASGTATLEVGLLGTPMVMVYRLAGWTYALARLLVRLPNVALVNLVLGRRVVPELIQGQANPERIAAEAARLLTDAAARSAMRKALAEVRGRLGAGGASGRAASEVAEMLAEASRN
ncbi:MAG TPA: lipid-A-disaccharide synthase [Thermoanaerobaculia bacterium]|jgi:lipid-A-disaccharide synthase|nr:lipid-A-disaccharide synthase [Thermoanaerobaculia bacterium]